MKKEKLIDEEAFDQYYSQIFESRYDLLKKSLTPEISHTELKFQNCESYFLDAASIVSALCLPVHGSEKVLDLCAAPGGKTLVLAGNLDDEASMSSNERSPARKTRLAKVVAESLPSEINERITVSCSDGATWCKREVENYDSILLDAPCSSERHVLNDPKYLDVWTPSRIKTICMEEWALLSCAFRLLKNNGFLLYSTCALCPAENDEIIKKLLKKNQNVRIVSKDEVKNYFEKNLSSHKAEFICPENVSFEKIFSYAEQTEYGFHVLPDTSNGAGPLYFCLIQKMNLEQPQSQEV